MYVYIYICTYIHIHIYIIHKIVCVCACALLGHEMVDINTLYQGTQIVNYGFRKIPLLIRGDVNQVLASRGAS